MVAVEDIYEEAPQGYDVTGPYGVARDVRFTKITSGIYGAALKALVRESRIYLGGRGAS